MVTVLLLINCVHWIILPVRVFKNSRVKKQAYDSSWPILISELTICQRSSRWTWLNCKTMTDTIKHNSHESLLDFYKSLPKDEFPQLVEFAKKKVSLFGSTYKCEQLLSRMKFNKSKIRYRLTDLHLQNNLRVTMSSIALSINILVKNTQAQVPHLSQYFQCHSICTWTSVRTSMSS
jgi:hypothetical protein